jgi:hypothetical protein
MPRPGAWHHDTVSFADLKRRLPAGSRHENRYWLMQPSNPIFALIPMPRLLGRGTTNHENRVS